MALACAALTVSRTAFYQWHKHTPSSRELTDAELLANIRVTHHTLAFLTLAMVAHFASAVITAQRGQMPPSAS